MIGTLFLDRYRIDAQMGQGGMGVVYRAFDQRLARSVAIKVLNKSSIGTEGRAGGGPDGPGPGGVPRTVRATGLDAAASHRVAHA